MDRVIAELDVQPPQVLIEAVILQVALTKNMDLGASFALLDNAGKTLGTIGNATAMNAASRILAGFGGNLRRPDGQRVRRRHQRAEVRFCRPEWHRVRESPGIQG